MGLRAPLLALVAAALLLEGAGLHMPNLPFKAPQKRNAPGNLFVDESCVDCDACAWMCPKVFRRVGVKVVVGQQPQGDRERLQAFAAAVACPVGAIRTHAPDEGTRAAVQVFPSPIDRQRIPNVHHLGFHSPSTFATPYLLTLPQGNVMVDTPRFNARLASQLEAMGGLHTHVITNQDDLGDHLKWFHRFPSMQRVIHSVDSTADTRGFEVKLEGEGEWRPMPNVTIVHTPGHTAGSLCVQYQSPVECVLFSGDTISFNARSQELEAFQAFRSTNAEVQAAQIRRLAGTAFPFQWILPAHGRMFRFGDLREKRRLLLRAARAVEGAHAALR